MNKCLFLGFIFSKKRKELASGRTNYPKALWICAYVYVIFRGDAQPFTNAPGAFNLMQALDATRKKNEGRKVRHGKLKEKKFKNMQNTSC